MRASRRFPASVGIRLLFACLLASAAGVAACSEAAGSGDPSLVVTVLQDEITLENQTGTSLLKGEVTIVPRGIPRPYTMVLPYMSSGLKRSFPLNSFRMSDGSPFRRDVANGKTVKVTATDASGKSYEREVPFK